MKAYQIQMKSDSEAEINLYGEVVDSTPVDVWTGKPVDGLFIALDQFLNDLDGLKGASKLTFRINSVGGDAHAGVTIYNRIRELPGEKTTIVDGLAASAASIIAQAGDRRIMNTGTQEMIHGASCFLFGYHNEGTLMKARKMLTSTNKAIAEIYAERSGRDVDEILAMMKSEKWMTADEAVEEGFADVVQGREEPKAVATDGAIIVNGITHRLRGLPRPIMRLVESTETTAEASALADEIKTKEGGTVMNLEELKAKYPELVDEIQAETLMEVSKAHQTEVDECIKDALEKDRARMKAIDEIANQIGDPALVQKAKYDEPVTAEQLALEAMRAQAKQAETFSALRAKEVAPASDVAPSPVDGVEGESNADIIADAKAAAQAFIASKGGQK